MKIKSTLFLACVAVSLNAFSTWAVAGIEEGADAYSQAASSDPSPADSGAGALDEEFNGFGGGHGGGGHGGGGHGGGGHGPHPSPWPGPHPGPHPHPGPWPGPHPGPGHVHHPYPTHGGHTPWHHWPHREFPRPVYDWHWGNLRVVTCTAADSYGDQYPVTEDGYFGREYRERLAEIEDAALDRCYEESSGDEGCYLLGCNPGY